MNNIILIKMEGDATEVKAAVGGMKMKGRFLFLDAEAFDKINFYLNPLHRLESASFKKRGIETLIVGDRLISKMIAGKEYT